MSSRGLPGTKSPEHEFEAELGLPEPLPPGERLLWQGAPNWRILAREALLTRTLTVYFAVLLAWRGANVLSSGASAVDALVAIAWLLPAAALAIGMLSLIAWLIARTTVYTVTDKRVVMRIGVVLGITFNLPFGQIESAGLRTNRDGSGDITLVLGATDHIAYVHLWPHARPWHVKRTEPMLRALANVQQVASLLADALAETTTGHRAPVRAVKAQNRQSDNSAAPKPLAA